MIGAVPRTAWLRDAGVELDPNGFAPVFDVASAVADYVAWRADNPR